MRIDVSQPGRQHTHLLLNALFKKGILGKFYTVFAANKFSRLFNLLPKNFQKQFRKRSFPNIPRQKIEHRPSLFLQEQLGKISSEVDLIIKVYSPFDNWVANNLMKRPSEIIIGYENANVETFKKAKSLGITTILDLAQIHHNTILDIHRKFGFLNSSYSPEALEFINSRKALALEFTDYIITLSSFAKDSLIKNGIEESKILTVNLGLNHERFYPKTKYNESAVFRFLYVGTITQRKGLDILLEAFKSLNLTDSELVLVGPMSDAEELLNEYKDYFTHKPFLHHEELADEYRTADVFVFPSYLDSWAQTVVEAMACGTPVIVSENTGAKDAVFQGGGYVLPPGDLDAFKQKMHFLYKNRDVVSELGEKASEVAQQYTVKNYHSQIINALEQIANEKNKD